MNTWWYTNTWFSQHKKKGKEEALNNHRLYIQEKRAEKQGQQEVDCNISDIDHFIKVEKNLGEFLGDKGTINKNFRTEFEFSTADFNNANLKSLLDTGVVQFEQQGETTRVFIAPNKILPDDQAMQIALEGVGPEKMKNLLQDMFDFHAGSGTERYHALEEQASPAQDENYQATSTGRVKISVSKSIQPQIRMQKKVDSIQIKINLAKFDEKQKKELLRLFEGSGDQTKFDRLLFDYQENSLLPTYIMSLKDEWEGIVARYNEVFAKKISREMQKFNKLLALHKNKTRDLISAENLNMEAHVKQNKSRRLGLFVFLSVLLAAGEIPVNYQVTQAVLGEQYEWMVWVIVFSIGGLIVGTGEALAFVSSSNFDRTPSAFSVFCFALIFFLLTVVFYLRYTHAVTGEKNKIDSTQIFQLGESNSSQSGSTQNTSKPNWDALAKASFATILSALIFCLAVILGYWHKYGSLRHMWLQRRTDILEELIRQKISKLRSIYEAHLHDIDTLVQSGQREMREYIEGFKSQYGLITQGNSLSESEKSCLANFCNFMDKRLKSIPIKPGKGWFDGVNSIENYKSLLMADYEKSKREHVIDKNKVAAKRLGFEHGFDGHPSNPSRLIGQIGFSLDNLPGLQVENFQDAYHSGYEIGKKTHDLYKPTTQSPRS